MNLATPRFALSVAILLAFLASACGGGNNIPAPPPPVGGFTNADLNGQYAFSMAGVEARSTGISSFFTRIGAFTADGNARITGGVEDVNVATGVIRLDITGGNYSISADGRGTLNLITPNGTISLSITLSSSATGTMVDLPADGLATASGSFFKQDPTAFSLSGIANSYAFDFSGISSNALVTSIVGQFQANGSGVITTGMDDVNEDGGTTTAQAITGIYAADSLHVSDLTNFGRGVASITDSVAGQFDFIFYIVDRTHVRFMEDGSGALSGDALSQSNVPTTVNGVNGGFVFLMGGAGIGGPLTRAGRFTLSGGNLSTIFVDNNNAGDVTSQQVSTGTYTIDSTGNGRGTATFTHPGAGTFQFVFYLVSPTQGFIQDVSSPNFTMDGALRGQTGGPFSNTTLAGDYAFGWSGVSSTNLSTDEEDFVGQLDMTGGNFTGAVDFNEFASNLQFFDIVIDGDLTLNGDGTTHNAFVVNFHTSPSNRFQFFAYAVNNNTIFVMGTDTLRVIAGTLTRQP